MAALASGASHAVGVGDISVKSALNQPLEAEIELLGVTARDREQLTVVVAPRDVFDRMGIERSPLVDQLRFQVIEKPDGRMVVMVSTPGELQEPFLNFLIEANWPTGRLLREFTVLLDPPKLTEEKAQTPQAPETQAPQEIAAALPPPAPAPAPKAEQIPPPPPPIVEEPKESERVTVAPEVVPEAAPIIASSELQYGPVKSKEYLWNIADKMRPKNVHVSQMMLALLRDNPQAFIGNNINRLKEGQVLRVKDTAQMESVGVDEAIAEVERQYQEWLTFRQGRLGRHKATQLAADTKSANAEEGADAPAKKPPAGGVRKSAKGTRLELVTPKNKPTTAQAESERAAARQAAKELDKMRGELNQAASNLDRMRSDNKNKKTQLSSLEKQISDMQLLIALKDQELHLLQQRMRDHGIDPEEGAFKGREETPLGSLDLSVGADKKAPALDKSAKEKAEPAQPTAKDVAKPAPSSVLTNPWFWLGLGASLVSIGFGFWWWRGRKDQMQPWSPEADAAPEDTLATTIQKGRTKPIVIDDSAIVVDSAETASSGVVTKHENDPLSEAEVYLTYGRYQKAKEVLRSAIQSDPDRHELKLKLLETFYFAEDHVGFEKQAEELYAALGGRPGPLWDKAVEMGQDLVPDHPLFRRVGEANLADTIVIAPGKNAGEAQDLSETMVIDSAKSGAEKAKRIGAQEAVRPPAWAMEQSELARSRQRLEETIVMPPSASRPAEVSRHDEPSGYSSARSTPVEMEEVGRGNSAEMPAPPASGGQPPVTEEELLREEAEVRAMLEEAVSSYITAMEHSQDEPSDEKKSLGLSNFGKSSAARVRSQFESPQQEIESSSSALRKAVDHLDQAALEEHQQLQIHNADETAAPSHSQEFDETPQTQFSHSRFAALQDMAGDSVPHAPAARPGEPTTAYALALLDEENPLPNGAETERIEGEAEPSILLERAPEASATSGFRRTSPVAAPPNAESGLEDDLDEDTFFLFNDEIGTKLDLARAYIEMGDTDGAREILDEVLGEGSDKHRAEAQDLIRLVDKAATGHMS